MGFKGLIGKIFRNKDLPPQIKLQMDLGRLRGPAVGDGHTSGCTYQVSIIAQGERGVCDGDHRSVVMNATWAHKLANHMIVLSGLESFRSEERTLLREIAGLCAWRHYAQKSTMSADALSTIMSSPLLFVVTTFPGFWGKKYSNDSG
jgi:hypothetical protein